jgi:glycosyltransferase involved in cell wall biosynthesis
MPGTAANKRIAIVVSQILRSVAHEWTIEELCKRNYEVFVILMNKGNSKMEEFLLLNNIPFVRIPYGGKWSFPTAVVKMVSYFKKKKISIVHAHLFDAGLAAMIAAKWSGIHKRIYTRHHSTFHHEYFPGMVKYDRLINYLATDLIATSKVVKNVLEKEGVSGNKITTIHHGFRFEVFDNVSEERINNIKTKYDINGNPTIGVVARWTEWKGLQYIIPAFKRILPDYPDAQLILTNASGSFTEFIERILETLPAKNRRVIAFEEDFPALYGQFHMLIHTPVNEHCEAFGQVYIESLALGIPSVFSRSGIANEIPELDKYTIVVPYKSEEAILEGILWLLNNPGEASLRGQNGASMVRNNFRLEDMIDDFCDLYEK